MNVICSFQSRSPGSSIPSWRQRITVIYLHTVSTNLFMWSGCFCWMTSSLRPTKMESLLNAMMGCSTESTPEFSHIQRIIQKSKLCTLAIFTNWLSSNRILLVTIRDNGLCPCPRCYVPKSEFAYLGINSDIMARLSKARDYLQDKIRSASHAIYQHGEAIKSAAVEGILKECSLVPTLVSEIHQLCLYLMLNQTPRILLLSTFHRLALIYSKLLLWIFCMNLNSECWNPSSST